MQRLKLTKNELRTQENKAKQLRRYLPTLQLKKALVQSQVAEVKYQIQELGNELTTKLKATEEYAALFSHRLSIDITPFITIKSITKHIENIAGTEVPLFDAAVFSDITYDLFETPIWLEGAIYNLRNLSIVQGKILIAKERKELLEKELREISIRVNLFEKVLIPRCENNIKTIKIFLGDMALQAFGQSKVAKMKIERREIEEKKNNAY